ncbi:MAG: hypothetical protein VX030_11650 [SAR324 cluster bacterium]|nr:hypothetical protein [SAR324 cluster bacterium]
MKQLHRKDLFSWSVFNEERNIDFHGILWVRENGNVLIDPMPMSEHDLNHLEKLGGAAHLLITNSDHVRDAQNLVKRTGAKTWGPMAEKENFPFPCDDWLGEGDQPVSGLSVFALEGSKTPGELAFLLENTTLITGDLIRAHEGGKLCMLPDAKLKDRQAAVASVKRMASLENIQAVLPGDGWPIFSQGKEALNQLAASI